MIFYVDAKRSDEPDNKYREICVFHSKELADLAIGNLSVACPNWNFKTRHYSVGGFAIK